MSFLILCYPSDLIGVIEPDNSDSVCFLNSGYSYNWPPQHVRQALASSRGAEKFPRTGALPVHFCDVNRIREAREAARGSCLCLGPSAALHGGHPGKKLARRFRTVRAGAREYPYSQRSTTNRECPCCFTSKSTLFFFAVMESAL